MQYTVYENRANDRATVHKAFCGYLKMHGGVSRVVPPTGEYYEGFPTAEAAIAKAKATGRTVVRCCSNCKP